MWKIKLTKEIIYSNEYISKKFKNLISKKIFYLLGLGNLLCLFLIFLLMKLSQLSFNEIKIPFNFIDTFKTLFLIIVFFNIIFLFLYKILFKRNFLLKQYEYLISNFEITINDKVLNLNSESKNIFLNLKEVTIYEYKKSIILITNKNFEIILPLEKIENGETLKESLKMIGGKINDL